MADQKVGPFRVFLGDFKVVGIGFKIIFHLYILVKLGGGKCYSNYFSQDEPLYPSSASLKGCWISEKSEVSWWVNHL